MVAATREARRRPLARVLRLSGKAKAPEFFEMDDSLVAEKSSAPSASSPPGPAGDDLLAWWPYDVHK